MGPVVAIGGVHVPSENVRDLERAIDSCCAGFGFPPREEFKWSPGRELWMHGKLLGEHRERFFLAVLELVKDRGGQACVVIEDEGRAPATGEEVPHSEDVTWLYLERADWRLTQSDGQGIVITDRPGGGRQAEDQFLTSCLEKVLSGTAYVKFQRIALNVLATPSRLVRLLQVADLVVGCTTAFVSGETQYSPSVFGAGIRPLLASHQDRIGGIGLKLHPDYCYANLYHWLVGDSHLWRGNTGYPLPMVERAYHAGPDSP